MKESEVKKSADDKGQADDKGTDASQVAADGDPEKEKQNGKEDDGKTNEGIKIDGEGD